METILAKEESFSIPLRIEADLEKSASDPQENRYPIKLLAGDNTPDIQGEVVEPEGFLLGYFQKGGYFNYDHEKGSQNLIGEPTSHKLIKGKDGWVGLEVKGFLYKSRKKPVAQHVINHIEACQEAGSNRHVGASIEGKTLARDPRNQSRIVKAWIKNIAITEHPINRNSWVDLVKAFQTGQDIFPTDGGGTLRRQSIDKDVKVLTHGGPHADKNGYYAAYASFTDEEKFLAYNEVLKLLSGESYFDDMLGGYCGHFIAPGDPVGDVVGLREHLLTCRNLPEKIVEKIMGYLATQNARNKIAFITGQIN